MAKLPKLQWLPMLLEAYNEARTKSGLKPVTPGELLNGVIKESSVNSKKKETKVELAPSASKSAIRTKTTVRPPARMGRMEAKPAIKRHRNVGINTKLGIKTKQGEQFHSVLRELRRTRQKLAQVENLQTQLNQLQSTVERQLTELNQRIGDHTNSNVKSDGRQDTQTPSQNSPQSSGQGNTLSSSQKSQVTSPMAPHNTPKKD